MIVDLVKARVSDGVYLHGALHRRQPVAPDSGRATDPGRASGGPAVEVLLGLPGVGGNFYDSSLIEELTPLLTAGGLDVLWVNTRGHDRMCVVHSERGPRAEGAAYEIVDECRHDVAGWLDWLLGQGYERIGLLGHSLGAIKAVYSQAYEPHAAVACLVAVSPPRLSSQAFLAGPESSRYFEDLDSARRCIADGKPRELIRARVPFPLLISAATYVDKYGPEERYNLLRFADRVACPQLFVYGGEELEQGGVAFAGLPEAIAALESRHVRPVVETVPDANHMYSGRRGPLAETILGWLGGLPARS